MFGRFVATFLTVTGCIAPFTNAIAQDGKPVPADPWKGERYVAMGSSFAAGPGLPPAAVGGFARCGQSQANYPRLLAAQLGLNLTDVSCSGARTDHIIGPWAEIPPQIEAVSAETRLVTVTIGGNDLNYIGNLFNASCLTRVAAMQAAATATPASATGAAPTRPGAKIPNCSALKVPTDEEYARDEARLVEIATQIRTRAPKATIVFVQYLTPLPIGLLCTATPVRPEDAAITRTIGQRLAELTARAAQATGSIVVDMNRLSATHTPCDPVPWMIGDPPGYDGRQGLQWHLNGAGMKATADAIALALKSPPPPVVPAPPVATAPVKVNAPEFSPARPASSTRR